MARPKGTKRAYEKWLLDSVDRRIVALLQANARIRVSDLARHAGLSRTAAEARVRRLEARGVIAGYTIRLNDGSAWPKTQAFILLYLGGGHCKRVLPEIRKIPEIKAGYSLAGEIDMILFIEGEDVEHIEQVRSEIEAIAGVKDLDTRIVIKERFDSRSGRLPEIPQDSGDDSGVAPIGS